MIFKNQNGDTVQCSCPQGAQHVPPCPYATTSVPEHPVRTVTQVPAPQASMPVPQQSRAEMILQEIEKLIAARPPVQVN